MKYTSSQTGIGLVEALVAAIIFAIGIGAVVQLQGKFFKDSAAANARSIAESIAQEKLEDLRGFQVTDSSDTTVFDFTSITGDVRVPGAEPTHPGAGGQICNLPSNDKNGDGAINKLDIIPPPDIDRDGNGHLDGNDCTTLGVDLLHPAVTADATTKVTTDNLSFYRTWGVTDYYYNAGTLTTTPPPVPTPEIVQKLVTVTVGWRDNDGTPEGSPQTATLSTVINEISSASASGMVANNIGGSGEAPQVPYTPSTDSRVTPIGVGTSTKRETLVPSSQSVGGYTRTKFTAYTYNSNNMLVREEEFQNVACDCVFNGTSDANNPAKTAAHPEWSNIQGTYVDVDGEKVAGKAKGCVAGGGNNCASNPDELCSSCCQDHHDISSATHKYDPYRSSDDFTDGGDHKHYSGTSPVTSGHYLEACRMKRVNGFWQVYEDWHMADLTVLPLSDLQNSDIKTTYAGYVKSIVDEYLDESVVDVSNLTNGQSVLASPPAKPSALDHTVSNNYVSMAVPSTRDLTARAIYLDYVDPTHLAKVKEKKTAGNDYLLHLPFYEIEVAPVAGWSSADPSKVLVGPRTSPNLYGGQLSALATASAAINITGSIRRSNSGIDALVSSVDYNASVNPDSAAHSDVVGVCVGCVTGSCALPWGGSLASGGTVTAYLADSVPHGSSCSSQTRTCTNGSLSGTYTHQTCSVLPEGGCTTPWGTIVNSDTEVHAYNTAVVIQPDTCEAHQQERECEHGTWSSPFGTYTNASCSASQCHTTVSGTANNRTYTMTVNGGSGIDCPVSGSGQNRSYTCPTQTVNISGTVIVITESSGTTKTISSNVCGSKTANFR